MKRNSQFVLIPRMVVAASGLLSAQSLNHQRVVSIIADVEIEHVSVTPSGDSSTQTLGGRYYRDAYGRTRLEQGATTTIHDPVNRVTIMLDPTQRIARKAEHASGPPTQSAGPHASPQTRGAGPRTQLGTRNIDGIEVTGERFVTVLPVSTFTGSSRPIEQVTEVWLSKELQLPILVTVNDPISGSTTLRYKNIQRDVDVDRQLFEVPAGFQVVPGMAGALGPLQRRQPPATIP